MFATTKRFLIVLLLFTLSISTIYAQEHDMENMDENTVSETFLSNTAILLISGGVGVLAAGAAWIVAKDRLTILHYGIIVMLVTTGLIHVLYTWVSDILLFLNGLGYLGITLLYLLPMAANQPFKRILNVATIVYTLITIVGYFVIHVGGHFDTFGLITKAVEVLLLILIGMYMFRKDAASASA